MRLTKKNIVAVIEPLFEGCNMRLIEIGDYDVKVSPWNGQWRKDTIKDFIKIFQVIIKSDLIEEGYEVWRQEGYYDCTDDITMNFKLVKDKLRKL